MKVIQFIRVNHLFNRVAFSSATGLFLLVALLCLPISNNELETKATTGTAAESSITMNFTSSTASVDLTVNNTDGTFATSGAEDKAAFSIATNNYAGYTLSISAADDTGTLLNGSNSLDSISSNLTEAEFNTSANNGKWGYKPNKFYASNEVVDNTGDNAVFLSSPTTEATTLDVTNAANNEANEYNIALGATTDYTKPNGTYSKTFILTAVANKINYSVTYDANAGTDTVTNMPYESTNNVQSGDTNSTSITLSDLVPVREGYTFKGWCSVATSDDTCLGTIYNPGGAGTNLTYGIDQTVLNNGTIFAMWEKGVVTCTKQYRLQNADGTYPDEYTEDGSEELNSGETCTYAKTITDYQGDNGNDTERTISQVLKKDTTLSMDFPRNTYELTIDKIDSRIDTVTGAGTYRWGEVVPISATTFEDFSDFAAWSQTAGTGQGATTNFASAKSQNTTFTMPNSAATIYANGRARYIQDVILSDCTRDAYRVSDRRGKMARYSILLDNGFCSMNEPLNLGDSVPLTLTSEDTNIAEGTTYILPASSATMNDDHTFVVANYDPIYEVNYGMPAYYSHNVATAGSSDPTSSGDAEYDICPRGWRLPRYGETSSKYGSGIFGFSSYYGYYSTNYPTITQYGTDTTYAFKDRDTSDYVWTSTYLYQNRFRPYNGAYVASAGGGGRNLVNYFNAYPMRCILK